MFNFIGIGSAFNTNLGNNCAFLWQTRGHLFMIDCGETTFHRFKERGFLSNETTSVDIIITHFHPDHIGSLGSLIAFMYYARMPFTSRVNVYTPEPRTLRQLLTNMGVPENTYNLVTLEIHGKNIISLPGVRFMVTPVKVEHTSDLKCYGYMFDYLDLPSAYRVYYSGDSKNIPENILNELINNTIDVFYQDTSSLHYDDNVHLSLHNLDLLIPKDYELRNKIYCMHLDNKWDAKAAKALGFNTVRVIPVSVT